MSKGYIYCFINESMPFHVKIGMTLRTPVDRLAEANKSYTWKPPTPFKIAFAKKVNDPEKKEKSIHKILEMFDKRTNDKQEFFHISMDIAYKFFELLDGEWWTNVKVEQTDITENKQIEQKDVSENKQVEQIAITDTTAITAAAKNHTKRKHTTKCLKDGQHIKHIAKNDTRTCIYRAKDDKVEYNGQFTTLRQFCVQHNKDINPTKKTTDTWRECYCEINGKDVLLFDITA